MKAGFVYGENSLEILKFKYYAEDAYNGNPYNSAFDLKIVSGDFIGVAPCEYDIKKFLGFISELEEMYRFERDVVEFRDIYYGSRIMFENDRLGHIKISGTIYADCMEHSLKFHFDIDQTVILDFCTELRALVDSAGR